jgi:hypothetical protein
MRLQMTLFGTLFSNARMDTLYNGSNADLSDRCAVRIDDTQIRIEYTFDDERTQYEGRAIAPGHYRLECPERNGYATLHRIPDSSILEGSWIEDGERGMWRIELHETACV